MKFFLLYLFSFGGLAYLCPRFMKSFQHILHYTLSLLLLGLAFALSQQVELRFDDAGTSQVEQASGISATNIRGALPVLAMVCEDDQNQDEKKKHVKLVADVVYVDGSAATCFYEVDFRSTYYSQCPLFFSGTSPPYSGLS